MPVRRSDEEPLQKLTAELRGELDVKAREPQPPRNCDTRHSFGANH
jgi:hypothetical protein